MYRYREPPPVGRGAMFPQVDYLPPAQTTGTAGDRDSQPTLGEYGTHMGGHIVRSLQGMAKEGITIRCKPGYEGLQVPAHIRIGVFAQYQRSAGVLQEQVT